MRNAALPRSTGILQTRRRQLPWPHNRDFRILSLDGGGIKGLFTTSFLARLESTALAGAPIGDYFDLIAGTSTGGIVALGLAAGRSAAEILEMYQTSGGEIFPRKSSFGVFGPAFRPTKLHALLRDAVGERMIGDSMTRLCIPSCEGRFGDVNVFKTPHHPDFKLDWKVPMVEVGMASSAAPTILPVHPFGGYLYVDGGLWANNPAMVALVDALTCYAIEPRRVRILSIGTGSKAPALKGRHLSWGGLIAWLADGSLIESLMHYASLNADGQAGLMIGRDQLVRVAPSGSDAAIGMTDYRTANTRLVPAGAAAADELVELVAASFLNGPVDRPRFYYGPKGLPE